MIPKGVQIGTGGDHMGCQIIVKGVFDFCAASSDFLPGPKHKTDTPNTINGHSRTEPKEPSPPPPFLFKLLERPFAYAFLFS